jgi:hypothetical protein
MPVAPPVIKMVLPANFTVFPPLSRAAEGWANSAGRSIMAEDSHSFNQRRGPPMGKLMMYAKFAWVYTTSLFLPTAIVTPRVQKLLEEYEAMKAADAAKKQS